MTGGKVEVVAALICEDVRDELGDRSSLMGITAPILEFNEFPARQRMRVVLIANALAAGPCTITAELQFKGESKWEVELAAEISGVGQGVLVPYRPTMAVFDEPGDLELFVAVEGDRRKVQAWYIAQEDIEDA